MLPGEVLTKVPIRFIRSHSNRVEMTPDREVQEAIRSVFSQLNALGGRYLSMMAGEELGYAEGYKYD